MAHRPLTQKLPGIWYLPVRDVKLPDGTIKIIPGCPVRRGTVAEVSKATGVSHRTLIALAEAGFIRRARPSPNQSFYYFTEVEDHIRRTEEDPNFWNEVRRKAYLTGTSLKTARPKA